MLSPICGIRAACDGNYAYVTGEIPADAHYWGVSRYRRAYKLLLGENLGTPYGAEMLGSGIVVAADLMRQQLISAWTTEPLF